MARLPKASILSRVADTWHFAFHKSRESNVKGIHIDRHQWGGLSPLAESACAVVALEAAQESRVAEVNQRGDTGPGWFALWRDHIEVHHAHDVGPLDVG